MLKKAFFTHLILLKFTLFSGPVPQSNNASKSQPQLITQSEGVSNQQESNAVDQSNVRYESVTFKFSTSIGLETFKKQTSLNPNLLNLQSNSGQQTVCDETFYYITYIFPRPKMEQDVDHFIDLVLTANIIENLSSLGEIAEVIYLE